MSIDFVRPEVDELRPRICVIGVGGAGLNAVERMIEANIQGVEFLAVNTDAQQLATSEATVKVQLGSEITRGLGSGAAAPARARPARSPDSPEKSPSRNQGSSPAAVRASR